MNTAAGSGKAILLLRPQDTKGLIAVEEAIDLIEQGYREASEFPLINAPRRRVHSRKNVRVSSFPGGIDGLGVIGSLTRAESVAHDPKTQVYPYREHPVYLLWDPETSELEAILIGEIYFFFMNIFMEIMAQESVRVIKRAGPDSLPSYCSKAVSNSGR